MNGCGRGLKWQIPMIIFSIHTKRIQIQNNIGLIWTFQKKYVTLPHVFQKAREI